MIVRLLIVLFSFLSFSASQTIKTKFFSIDFDYLNNKVNYVVFDIPPFINKNNIKTRLRFDSIGLDVSKINYCYKHSGYDRGHLIPDRFFDVNKTMLKKIYIYENVVPETPNTNRSKVLKVENFISKNYKRIKKVVIVPKYNGSFLKNKKYCPQIPYLLLYIVVMDDKTLVFKIPNK